MPCTRVSGARGAALLAGRGLGWYADLSPPDFYPLGPTYCARSEKDAASMEGYAVYDRVYDIYKSLHRPLEKAFAELALIAQAR